MRYLTLALKNQMTTSSAEQWNNPNNKNLEKPLDLLVFICLKKNEGYVDLVNHQNRY